MVRRWHAAVLAVLAVFALACESKGSAGTAGSGDGGGGQPASSLPSSIVALGDSITVGFASCVAIVACAHNSWSTGTGDAVDSHYRRILADNAKIRGNRRNYAKAGARAADLPGQADAAVRAKPQYVTILIGANDACRASVDQMTSPETFRDQVDAALTRLARGLPKARVLVVSVPDLHRLWEVGRDDDRAVRAWARGICPSLLADPRSTARADDRRRRAVDDRVDDYNRELRAACRAYDGADCWYDNGAAHRFRFSLDLVSTRDFFHPNAAGQAKLAEVTFPRRWR